MIENQIISQLKVNYFNVEVMVFRLVKSKTVVHGSDWHFHKGVLWTDIPITMQDSKEQSGDEGEEERGREGEGEGEGGSYFMRGK